MPTFIVTTLESVEGKYRVEAETEEDARSKFGPMAGGSLIRWEGVEQTNYMAFDVAVTVIEKNEEQR